MPSKTKKKTKKINSTEKQTVETSVRVREKKVDGREKVSGDNIQVNTKKEAQSLNQVIQQIRQSSFWNRYDLPTWLFFAAVFVYLATRLIGLTQFPIYFFTDEAIQTQSVVNLVNHDYRLYDVFLPTYFRNGNYFNLGLSVYLQWLPYILFGKSAILTRLTSILITLIAVVSISLILRDIFKLKYWWAGALFLSITPAWFLHSRTAFETVEFVAFYTGALCAYLFYRYKSPNYLYVSFFFAACAFYTYSPAQFIVPLTVIALLFCDWRYHAKNSRTIIFGVGLAFILGIPYFRFIFYNPHIPFAHLSTLGSYWLTDTTTTEKFTHYVSEYLIGLSPWYWYTPNLRDFSRHLMKDYGHIMLATLPFAIVGITYVLRHLQESVNRVILFITLIAPSAAALVGIGITRALAFVIPVCIFTAIGFERVLDWIQSPYSRLQELSVGLGLHWRRVTLSLFIFLVGIILAFGAQQTIDRLVLLSITVLLTIQVSGIGEYIAQRLIHTKYLKFVQSWNLKQTFVAITAFAILSFASISMLIDALRNGPTWYSDYGLGGMQYGGFQIFDILKQYKEEHPDTTIIFSPDWANGADVLAYFFLDDPLPIKLGSIRGHVNEIKPLDNSMLFVITPQEYQQVFGNPKFADIQIEKVVPYPDGSPGFYFISLRYSDNVDEVFAAEEAARHVLEESDLMINGEEVKVRYSKLDSGMPEESLALLFDGDSLTMAKTYEANPFVVELTYPTPHTIKEFSIVIGSANVAVTITGYANKDAEPISYTFKGRGTIRSPELTFKLPEPLIAQIVRIEQLDIYASEPTQNHIWEITFR